MRRDKIGKKVARTRVIEAWIGYCDDKPYVFHNEHGQREWCVFTNRKDAKKAFEDVRAVQLRIGE